MFQTVKDALKGSVLAQRAYRRYIRPHMLQDEPEMYILKDMKFDQCVDVGAHVGTYSILLSRNCNLVYAFEPAPHVFNILQNLNVRNVVAYNVALGSENGEAEMSFPSADGKIDHALATLRPLSPGDWRSIETHTVKVARYDDFTAKIGCDYKRIDFVKIDVEGFEMQTLLGMDRFLNAKKPDLMIEIERRHNPSYAKVFDYLRLLQYDPFVSVDGIGLQRLDAAELPELQTNDKLLRDEARKFRRGERKNYINNIFFVQPARQRHYQIT
jgi:FkbM family methyltransferase